MTTSEVRFLKCSLELFNGSSMQKGIFYQTIDKTSIEIIFDNLKSDKKSKLDNLLMHVCVHGDTI